MTIFCSACGKLNPPDLAICDFCKSPITRYADDGTLVSGTVINNRYRIDKVIKVGGMGAVYRGFDIKKEEIIAIKELYINLTNDDDDMDLVARFEREAELLAKLDHPNLPLVSDYFYDYDNYFMIMDYIDGRDLEGILEEEGKPGLKEDRVIEWAVQICSVLDYLHNHNPPILYRDVKPANIMIQDADNRAILVDFGIARELSQGVTSAHTVIGTIGYSPPEQFEGRQKPVSDIYSLGATLHHLLTGKFPDVPFRFQPPTKLNDRLSKGIEEIVMKALELEIDLRFKSAGEMKEALVKLKEPKKEKKKRKKIINKDELNDKEWKAMAQSKVHSKRGMIYAKQGYYDKARDEFEKSVSLFDYSAEEYSNLGFTCLKLKDYDSAEKYFREAIELDPYLAEAYSNLGVIYTRRGDLKGATEEYKKALELNPKLVETYINLADIYGKLNMFEEMVSQCERAIKLKPDCVEAYINFAYGCAKLSLYEDGIKKLTKALFVDSSNPSVYSNMGVLYGEIRDYGKAEKCLTRAIDLDPFFAEAYSNLGVIYHNQGNYDGALKSFKAALKLDSNIPQARNSLALMCTKEELDVYEKNEIVKLLNAETEKTEEPAEIKAASGEIVKTSALVRKDSSENGNIAEERAIKNPVTPEEFIESGKSYMEVGKTDEAIKQFQQSLRLKPKLVEGHYLMAIAYEVKGMAFLAESEYRDALEIEPKHLKATLRLGQLLFKNNALDELIELYSKYLKLNKEAPEIYYRLGLVYKEKKEYKKALRAFEDANTRGLELGDNYFNLGFISYELSNDDDAEFYFKRAISSELDSPDAYLYLGNIFYKRKLFAQAMHNYQKAIEINPGYAIAYSNLGAVYSDMNKLEEAEKNYNEALELDPDIIEVHRNLGVLYQKRGEFEKAIEEMKVYLTSSSDIRDRKEISKRIKDMEFALLRRGIGKLIRR